MSAQEDRGHLSEHLESLKAEFDNLDFNVLDDRKIIEQLLDKLVDAEIRITQFKEKRGLGDWNSWGPSLWNNIERNRITLERKLARIQLVELRDMEEKNQKRSFWSVFLGGSCCVSSIGIGIFVIQVTKAMTIAANTALKVDANSAALHWRPLA